MLLGQRAAAPSRSIVLDRDQESLRFPPPSTRGAPSRQKWDEGVRFLSNAPQQPYPTWQRDARLAIFSDALSERRGSWSRRDFLELRSGPWLGTERFGNPKHTWDFRCLGESNQRSGASQAKLQRIVTMGTRLAMRSDRTTESSASLAGDAGDHTHEDCDSKHESRPPPRARSGLRKKRESRLHSCSTQL